MTTAGGLIVHPEYALTKADPEIKVISVVGAAPTPPEPPPSSSSSLVLDGYSDHGIVTDPKFTLTQWTFEAWIWLDDLGAVSSGTGTLNGYPICARGVSPSAVGDPGNYWFGVFNDLRLRIVYANNAGVGSVLAGTRVLKRKAWYHVATTRDAATSTTKLWIFGVQDATAVQADVPCILSNRPYSIATTWVEALNPQNRGAFPGRIRNNRIWSRALLQSEIIASSLAPFAPIGISGLIEDFPLTPDRFSQTGIVVIDDSVPGYTQIPIQTHTGTQGTILTHLGVVAWSEDEPPYLLDEPGIPTLVAPGEGATVAGPVATLQASFTDVDNNTNTVEFLGRRYKSPADFTLMFLPDTQEQASGFPDRLREGFDWIAATAVAQNTKATIGLGDHVDQNVVGQWELNDECFDKLDAIGMPYILCVGNHDNDANPNGTALFNTYFGEARFSGKPYYLGHFGTDNDNSAIRFQVSSDPVLYCTVITVEYDYNVTRPDQIVWTRTIATQYPNDIVIVTCHYLLTQGSPGYTSPQWDLLYATLKDLPQVKLFFAGHFSQATRKDVYQGHTLWSIMADYQFNTSAFVARPVVFSARNGTQFHRSYNVSIASYRVESQSEFTLPFDFPGAPAFELIGTVTNVAPGATATLNWSGLTPGNYEWFTRTKNGPITRDSSRRGFVVT